MRIFLTTILFLKAFGISCSVFVLVFVFVPFKVWSWSFAQSAKVQKFKCRRIWSMYFNRLSFTLCFKNSKASYVNFIIFSMFLKLSLNLVLFYFFCLVFQCANHNLSYEISIDACKYSWKVKKKIYKFHVDIRG